MPERANSRHYLTVFFSSSFRWLKNALHVLRRCQRITGELKFTHFSSVIFFSLSLSRHFIKKRFFYSYTDLLFTMIEKRSISWVLVFVPPLSELSLASSDHNSRKHVLFCGYLNNEIMSTCANSPTINTILNGIWTEISVFWFNIFLFFCDASFQCKWNVSESNWKQQERSIYTIFIFYIL